jgi:hypothetical protein
MERFEAWRPEKSDADLRLARPAESIGPMPATESGLALPHFRTVFDLVAGMEQNLIALS